VAVEVQDPGASRLSRGRFARRFRRSGTNGVESTATARPDSVLQAGHNAWRIERADRATVLVDAGAYYGALRSAMRNARHTIYIAGWDINSRTRLVGESGVPDDDLPECLGDFLAALVQRRPKLSIRLLLWDFSVVYLLARELPTIALQWKTPRQIELCLDDDLPTGSCHHQKIAVIDDEIAFSGGLDLTIRRWDSCEHKVTNASRIDPSGVPYAPFHDVQMLVDGPAAKALGSLFRERWARASLERLPRPRSSGDVWPEEVVPDFRNTLIAISRTDPAYLDKAEIREVEQLFFDMIAAARQFIYIENQFLTCERLAERIATALQDNKDLEVLIVLPHATDEWFGPRAFLAGRGRFMSILRASGAGDRVLVAYPSVREGDETANVMVHSKVMIVDDRFLRIGSANICNRSMRTDTECDLTIEAANAEERKAVAAVRDRMVGEHAGLTARQLSARVKQSGSFLKAVEPSGGDGHSLVPIPDDPNTDPEPISQMELLADPEKPINLAGFVGEGGRTFRSRRRAIARIAILLASLLLLALAWRYTRLSGLAQPGAMEALLATIGESPWAPLAVVAVFAIGGLTGFPVTVLIAATALSFGAWPGLPYAAIGSLASASITYGLGSWLGTKPLRRFMGPRLNRIRSAIAKQGIVAMTTIRLVPIAPFTVVNLVAGAFGISFKDYLIGTILGLAPGLLAMTLLGDRLLRALQNPSLFHISILMALIVAWIGLTIGLQMLISHRGRRGGER
jgi:phospholipase D1/2